MSTYNVYETKTKLSKLLTAVEAGDSFTIARAGKPIADVTKHKQKPQVKFGTATGKIKFNDEDFVGIDPEIQEMFYGKDWQK